MREWGEEWIVNDYFLQQCRSAAVVTFDAVLQATFVNTSCADVHHGYLSGNPTPAPISRWLSSCSEPKRQQESSSLAGRTMAFGTISKFPLYAVPIPTERVVHLENLGSHARGGQSRGHRNSQPFRDAAFHVLGERVLSSLDAVLHVAKARSGIIHQIIKPP